MSSTMPLWFTLIFSIVILYIIISIALYYLQDYALFKPEKLPEDFQFYYDNQETKEYNLTTRDGAIINGLRFMPKGESKGIVLYLKGNSKSIKGWGKFAVDFTRHGYNVLMVDYRGFGKSTGKRSQKAIKRDLQLVYNKIMEITTEDRIILYGRSLGSGFATKLASLNNPKMLVLDAPYYSLTRVTARYMPFMPLSLSWTGKGTLKTLTTMEAAAPATPLIGHHLYSAMYANELLVYLLQESEPNEDIYFHYEKLLSMLSNTQYSIEAALRQFEFALLAVLGYEIGFSHDAETQLPLKASEYYYYVHEQGFVAANAHPEIRGMSFDGESLLGISVSNYERPNTLQAAKQIARMALKPYLRNRPLHSKELFLVH